MKSLRLNKEMRSTILKSFLDKYDAANVKPKETSLDLLGNKLALAVQKKHWEPETKGIPAKYLNTQYYIKFKLPTESVVGFHYDWDEEGDSIYLPTPKVDGVHYVFTDTDPLWVAYQVEVTAAKANNKLVDEWVKARSKFKSEVQQVLESVNTTGQLLEVWPEALPFVPQEISNPSSINLPAVNFAELNKVIG